MQKIIDFLGHLPSYIWNPTDKTTARYFLYRQVYHLLASSLIGLLAWALSYLTGSQIWAPSIVFGILMFFVMFNELGDQLKWQHPAKCFIDIFVWTFGFVSVILIAGNL